MKLTISTKIQSFTIDLPDDECAERFRELVGTVISAKTAPSSVEADTPDFPVENEPEPEPELEEEPEPEPIERALPIVERPVPLQPAPVPDRYSEPALYKGFLYIKCPKCGEARGFNAKNEISRYYCNSCGASCELPADLTPLFVNCECGRRFKYMTNITEDLFDIPCLNCGSPVPVQYNPRSNSYETIGRAQRRKKHA